VVDAETAHDTDDAIRPVPPRYWWLKRILAATIVVLAGMAVLRWRVGVIAEERLQARVDAIKAAGEPLLPEDFNPEPVPDDDNAAILLNRAAEQCVPEPPGAARLQDVLSDPSLCYSQAAAVEGLLDANQKTLELLRRAHSKPGIDWGFRFKSPLLKFKHSRIDVHGQVAQLACAAALFEHARGNDWAPLEHVRDTLSYADRLNELPALLGHLMAVFASSAAVSALQDIVPTLELAPDSAESPAVRANLRELIAVLLDDTALRNGGVRAFQFERALMYDTTRYLKRCSLEDILGRFPNLWQRFVGRIELFLFWPMFQLDTVRLLDGLTAYAKAVGAPNVPVALSFLPDTSTASFDSLRVRLARVLSALLMPSFTGTVVRRAEDIATRRLAAAAIAVRLYESDHGHRPATLAELVPDYLPYVPIDPMSASDEPILHFPDGPKARLALRALDGAARAADGSAEWEDEATAESKVFWLERQTAKEPAPSVTSQPHSAHRVKERSNVEREPGQTNDDESADKDP
jgi:hypothetical protein